MISIVVSIVTSSFTINLLYEYSGQKGFWICAFALAYVYVQLFAALIDKCFYTRREAQDIDKVTLQLLIGIVTLTIMFVLVTLLLDVVKFFMAITPMQWYDYVNILAFMLGFALFIFPHIDLA